MDDFRADASLLASHDLSPQTAVCGRCGLSYKAVVTSGARCNEVATVERPWPARRTPLSDGYAARLTPPSSTYGWVRAVVPPSMRDGLIAAAKKQRVTLSEIVRQACRAFLVAGGTQAWDDEDLRRAVQRATPGWSRKPVELEGLMLVFGLTPAMVDDLIRELHRGGTQH